MICDMFEWITHLRRPVMFVPILFRFRLPLRGGQGQPVSNLVWKDTVLLRAGETADILLYVTNPGLWTGPTAISPSTSRAG